MSPSLVVALVLLWTALLVSFPGWWLRPGRWHRWAGIAMLLLTGGAALLLALRGLPTADSDGGQVLVVLVTGALALVGGGPLTTAVFGLVDGEDAPSRQSVRQAAEVLRGGAWIGALERIAIFSSMAVGWPEGLAITLAIKGLGRYPELRHQDRPGIAERFLIGTFVSVLWAAACAGLALLLLP